MEGVFAQYKPDWVLVHGDTSTTLGTSLAAYYQQVGVAHVEAGLRTNNLYSPWPEEANRQLTGRLAGLHFAPTPQAQTNLLQEGVNPANVHVTGNTVIDALLSISHRLDKDAVLNSNLAAQFPFLDSSKRLVLVTGHCFADDLASVCAHQLHCSCSNGFWPLGCFTHDQYRLAQRGGLFLNTARVSKDAMATLHQVDKGQVV